MYPKDEGEAGKFALGVIKTLHSEKTRPRIMKQLTNTQAPIAMRLAVVTSQVLKTMVDRVDQQAQGRRPHIQLMVNSIQLIITELAKMCKAAGIAVTKDDQMKAAKLAGDMIEQAQNGQQQQGQPQAAPQQPQQPQGLLGGMV